MSNLSTVTNERQALACILSEPDLTLQFDDNYFLSDFGQVVLEVVQDLHVKNIPVTDEHIISEGNKQCDEITKENLTIIREQEYTFDAFEKMYYPRLKKDFAKYQITNRLLKDSLQSVSTKGELNVEKLRSALFEIERNLDLIDGKESKLLTGEQIGKAYLAHVRRRERGIMKYSSGCSHLDKALKMGFAPGQITTIFGATGAGKSAYVLNLVNKMIRKRMPSIYISLEMDLISTMDRLIGIRRGLREADLLPDENGFIQPHIMEEIEKEADSLSKQKHFHFVEDPSLSIPDIHQLIKTAQKRSGSKYQIVVIDLATMIQDFSGADAKKYEENLNRLHVIARKEGVHLVLVVQANRSTDDKAITSIESLHLLRPKPNSIKNSATFLERSRIVLSVFRPKYYAVRLFPGDPQLEIMDDIAEIQVLKQSQGVVGTVVKYLYDGEIFRYHPFFDDEAQRAA